MKKWILILFLTANAVVVIGQLWPGGVPALASKATLMFLIATAGYFGASLFKLNWKGRRKLG